MCIEQDIDAKLLYYDMHRNTNAISRARDAWLFNICIKTEHFSFVPRAIKIELIYCERGVGVRVSPFTYAYYLMFLCYHGLRQYDNRDRALRQLVDTVSDDSRCSVIRFQSYNIVGHCMLVAGYTEMARRMFLKSVQFSHGVHPFVDKHNPAYFYLSCM